MLWRANLSIEVHRVKTVRGKRSNLGAMGLLFQTPVELNELDDRISTGKDGSLRIRTYGLPMVFWGYLLAIFGVLFFMILAIKEPLMKVLTGEDAINQFIGLCVLAIFILGPLTLLAFYFYEKEILKRGNTLRITHRTFFLPVWRKSFSLEDAQLELEHFLDSPNMAAKTKKQGMAGFENRGYFKLIVKTKSGKSYLVDRNGRRGEMRKLKELLENH